MRFPMMANRQVIIVKEAQSLQKIDILVFIRRKATGVNSFGA